MGGVRECERNGVKLGGGCEFDEGNTGERFKMGVCMYVLKNILNNVDRFNWLTEQGLHWGG